MLGRVARAAHRSSTRNTWRKQQTSVVLCRCYATNSSAQLQTSVQDSNTPPNTIDLLDNETFARHKLPKSDNNLLLVRAYEMVREAEDVITKEEDFERAEAMLVGVLAFIQRHNLQDVWIKAAAQANLGYTLHQRFDYQGALQHYSAGVPGLAKEPVKDRRFLALRLIGYAECMSIVGNHEAAERVCAKAATEMENAVGADDAMVGLAYNNLASYLLLNNKAKLAAAPAERAFGILSKVLGKHNDTTRNCAVNLANIYRQLNRNDDLESLDAKFLKEDEPILAPETGKYAPEYIEKLKARWHSQGPRKIFDPPGLHRSSELSAQSYQAFLKAWTSKMPVTPGGAQVFSNELKSLGYSFDKLPKFTKRHMPKGATDRPHKVKTGFEHLKLEEQTSFAKLLDQEEQDMSESVPFSDLKITDDEWRGILERKIAFQKQHGSPMLEAELAEMEKSEQFFERIASEQDSENDDKPPTEEKEQEEEEEGGLLAKEEQKMEKEFKYLQGQDTSDWDQDTYSAKGALHGDKYLQEHERSKNYENPQGEEMREDPPEDPYADFIEPNPKDTDLRTFARFTREYPEEGEGDYYDKTKDPRIVRTKTPYSDLAEGPTKAGTTPKSATTKSGRKSDAKSGEKDPYAFNEAEDDVFPETPQKDRSHDKTRTNVAEKKKWEDAAADEVGETDYKHGRLHGVGWHDDNN